MLRSLRCIRLLNLAFLAAAGLWLWSGSAVGAEADQHFGAACESCHLDPGDMAPEHATRLTSSQERLCGGCHSGAAEASHPIGFAPSRPLPPDFPLDARGEFACSTCHDVHNNAPGRLRGAAAGGDFCLACHEPSFFDQMPDGGVSLGSSGHLASGHLDARRAEPSSLDQYSLRCIDCHDDRLSLVNGGRRVSSTVPVFTGAANHPIGMSYTRLTGVRGYHPSFELPKEVLLPEGRVSCISCHAGYSQQHGALVRPTPRLCLDCHAL